MSAQPVLTPWPVGETVRLWAPGHELHGQPVLVIAYRHLEFRYTPATAHLDPVHAARPNACLQLRGPWNWKHEEEYQRARRICVAGNDWPM